jgi:hypothetical protein
MTSGSWSDARQRDTACLLKPQGQAELPAKCGEIYGRRALHNSAITARCVRRGSLPKVEVPCDVLTWIVLGLTAWLAIGVLTATLFGALVSTSESDASRAD